MFQPVFLLLAIFIALLCSFSSAFYNHSYEASNVKMITENDWPSHGPWIVTIGYGTNELVIEKARTIHLSLQREAKKKSEEESVHSFTVKNTFSDLAGVNAVVLEGLNKNDLESISEVFSVYPDLPVYPTAYSWGTDRIDQSSLPLSTINGSRYNPDFKGCGVDIYVIDSGIDTKHIEFAPVNGVSRIVANIFNKYGKVTANTDGHGHGTHCAGSAGGNTVGTAPCANIYGLKILDDNNKNAFTSDMLYAMNIVKQRHVSNPNAKSVVSMSIAGFCGIFGCDGNPVFEAVSTMYDLGILFAVAAGNDYNANACGYFPASAPKAVTVAASTEFDNLADFSNTGPCVDIIAPGSQINSAMTGTSSYVLKSGTSMATPHVAGTLALLLEKKMVSFTTAPDIVMAALLCDAVKEKIQNIVPDTVNLLLQVPKNDKRFGDCLTPTSRSSFRPTTKPSTAPSTTISTTTAVPTRALTKKPSTRPSLAPSKSLSIKPSVRPSARPSAPIRFPTSNPLKSIPTIFPSKIQSSKSSKSPTKKITAVPSTAPEATVTIGDGCSYMKAGYYCVGGRALSCPAGFFCPGGEGGYGYSCPSQSTSSPGMSVCVPLTFTYGGSTRCNCLGGFDGGCIGCGGGEYCASDVQRGSVCYNCPAGSYCPGNNRGYLCPAGTSNSRSGQMACVPNTPPVYGDSCGNGLYECLDAGKYCDISQGGCFDCPAGTYCPFAFGSYAYECPVGKTSRKGAVTCH